MNIRKAGLQELRTYLGDLFAERNKTAGKIRAVEDRIFTLEQQRVTSLGRSLGVRKLSLKERYEKALEIVRDSGFDYSARSVRDPWSDDTHFGWRIVVRGASKLVMAKVEALADDWDWARKRTHGEEDGKTFFFEDTEESLKEARLRYHARPGRVA